MAKKNKSVGNLSYREWQARNSLLFKECSRQQQQDLRQRGYRNVGWENVRKSWDILREYLQQSRQEHGLTVSDSRNVTSLFDRKLDRGHIAGAIDISLLEAEQAKQVVQEALTSLEEGHAKIETLADDILKKYQLI